jgi:hypothetical protein
VWEVTAAERRRWHIAFVQLMGRDGQSMNHRDEDEMRALRSDGVSPEGAVRIIKARLVERHGERQ